MGERTTEPPGEFTTDWEPDLRECPQCEREAVQWRDWSSDCGGFVDVEHQCTACGYTWWLDGPDA